VTQTKREELAVLFRGKLPSVPAVETMIAEDIEKVEPFIDDLVNQGEMRGKLEAWFAIGADMQREARKMPIRKPFNRKVMDGTPTPF